MTTIYTLKETLHDRIAILEAALDQQGNVVHGPRGETFERGMLEGRLEEACVMFRLVDQVASDTATRKQEEEADHPLLYVSADEIDPDRYDPGRC